MTEVAVGQRWSFITRDGERRDYTVAAAEQTQYGRFAWLDRDDDPSVGQQAIVTHAWLKEGPSKSRGYWVETAALDQRAAA